MLLGQQHRVELRLWGWWCWWLRLVSSSSWGWLGHPPCTSRSHSRAAAARCSIVRSRGRSPSDPRRWSRTSRWCTCSRTMLVVCSIQTTDFKHKIKINKRTFKLISYINISSLQSLFLESCYVYTNILFSVNFDRLKRKSHSKKKHSNFLQGKK